MAGGWHGNHSYQSNNPMPWMNNNAIQNAGMPQLHHHHQINPQFTYASYAVMPMAVIKQWSFVDRVGGQFVVINTYDNLRIPEKPPENLSHFSHSPPNLARYNAERSHHFHEKLEEAVISLEKFRMNQKSMTPIVWNRGPRSSKEKRTKKAAGRHG